MKSKYKVRDTQRAECEPRGGQACMAWPARGGQGRERRWPLGTGRQGTRCSSAALHLSRGFSQARREEKFQSRNPAAEYGRPWCAAHGELRSCASIAPNQEEFLETFPEKKSDFFSPVWSLSPSPLRVSSSQGNAQRPTYVTQTPPQPSPRSSIQGQARQELPAVTLHSYKTKCLCFLFIHTVPANIRLK